MPTLAVFIDGGYIDAICRQHFDGLRVDYQKLGAEIQRRIGQGSAGPLEHLRTYYYTCPPYQDDPPTAEDRRRLSGYQRFRDAVGYLPRFELREGRLQKTGEAEDGRDVRSSSRSASTCYWGSISRCSAPSSRSRTWRSWPATGTSIRR